MKAMKKRWVFFFSILILTSISALTIKTAAALPVRYNEVVERLADRWLEEPEFFKDSPVYNAYIVDDIFIYGFGSSPYKHQGETLIYYNYSDPTVFFLPPNHNGGRLFVYVFYHGSTPVDSVSLSLNDKNYLLKPVRPTMEFIYDAWLQKRLVWEPGLVLSIDVSSQDRYVKLQADNPRILFAEVSFQEKSAKRLKTTPSIPKPVKTDTLELETIDAPKIAEKTEAVKTETITPTTTDKKFGTGGLVLISPNTGANLWPRYTSTKWGFSIAYPEGWTYTEPSGQSLLELTPPKGEKRIIITRDLLNKPLKEFVLQMENIVGMITISREEIEKDESVLQRAQVQLGSDTFYLDILYVKQRNFVFTVTAIAPEASKDDYKKEVNDILLSFSTF